MDKHTPKLWQPTKMLNGDNDEQSRATLQTTNGAATENVAQNVLAKVF